MIVILYESTFIIFSCLHFGQYKGKYTNVVFFNILVLVLDSQIGHRIHIDSVNNISSNTYSFNK